MANSGEKARESLAVGFIRQHVESFRYRPQASKWPGLSIRAADGRFLIVPRKQFISGQAEPFLIKGWRSNDRFIKADGRYINNDCRFINKARSPEFGCE